MTELFNKEDILTIATSDQAVPKTKGYFGNSVHDLINSVKNNIVRTLLEFDDTTYCFKCGDELYFTYFLPIDKVKISELFNKEDVKSWTTCSEVKISEDGYFGFNLLDLEYRIKNETPKKLSGINEVSVNAFKAEGVWYPFFLPANKVKEPVYRPLKTFDELFNFLMPNNDEKDPDRKAELLLGKVYRLKEKTTGNLSYRFFHVINQYDGIIRINGLDLEYLFDKYEIKKNGKWVPFGIEN